MEKELDVAISRVSDPMFYRTGSCSEMNIYSDILSYYEKMEDPDFMFIEQIFKNRVRYLLKVLLYNQSNYIKNMLKEENDINMYIAYIINDFTQAPYNMIYDINLYIEKPDKPQMSFLYKYNIDQFTLMVSSLIFNSIDMGYNYNECDSDDKAKELMKIQTTISLCLSYSLCKMIEELIYEVNCILLKNCK